MQEIVDKNSRLKNKTKHIGGILHEKNIHVEDFYNMGLDPGSKKNYVE